MLEIRTKHDQKRPNYDQNGKKNPDMTKNNQNMAINDQKWKKWPLSTKKSSIMTKIWPKMTKNGYK